MEPVDSDSEPSEGARRFGEDVAHRLNATRTPFVTGILVEVAFASLMTRWMAESTREKSPLFNVSEEFIVQVTWVILRVVKGQALFWDSCQGVERSFVECCAFCPAISDFLLSATQFFDTKCAWEHLISKAGPEIVDIFRIVLA